MSKPDDTDNRSITLAFLAATAACQGIAGEGT